MRCLKRNKRLIYLCTQYEDNGISKYKEPIEMRVNYQSTNSESDLVALGTEFPMYVRIKADVKYASMFHTGDKVYLNNICYSVYRFSKLKNIIGSIISKFLFYIFN